MMASKRYHAPSSAENSYMTQASELIFTNTSELQIHIYHASHLSSPSSKEEEECQMFRVDSASRTGESVCLMFTIQFT